MKSSRPWAQEEFPMRRDDDEPLLTSWSRGWLVEMLRKAEARRCSGHEVHTYGCISVSATLLLCKWSLRVAIIVGRGVGDVFFREDIACHDHQLLMAPEFNNWWLKA